TCLPTHVSRNTPTLNNCHSERSEESAFVFCLALVARNRVPQRICARVFAAPSYGSRNCCLICARSFSARARRRVTLRSKMKKIAQKAKYAANRLQKFCITPPCYVSSNADSRHFADKPRY